MFDFWTSHLKVQKWCNIVKVSNRKNNDEYKDVTVFLKEGQTHELNSNGTKYFCSLLHVLTKWACGSQYVPGSSFYPLKHKQKFKVANRIQWKIISVFCTSMHSTKSLWFTIQICEFFSTRFPKNYPWHNILLRITP